MYSQAEENYLKTIYSLEKDFGNEVSTNLIAGKIKTKASSVTDMLKKLANKELVVYKKYQGVYLTELGRLSALKVIRKHRLWECFLVQKLQFNWDEVHDIAEQLEHVKSEALINKLDAFLKFPKLDPHGDPIPDAHGRTILNKSISISAMKIGGVLRYHPVITIVYTAVSSMTTTVGSGSTTVPHRYIATGSMTIPLASALPSIIQM